MTWDFFLGGTSAKNTETGAEFSVTYRTRNIKSIDDFHILPTGESARGLTEDELCAIKQELWAHHVDRQVRDEVAALIQREFFGENHRAAKAITQMTGKNVSERTIQSWLIDPTRVSSRKCPPWALKAMRDYLEVPEKKRNLEELAQYKREFPRELRFVDEVYDKHQVRIATNEIEHEKQVRISWEEASYNSLPTKIYEFESRIESHLQHLSNTLATITNTLKNCNDFDDFKRKVCADLRGSTLHPDFRPFSESASSTGAGLKAATAKALWWHVCNKRAQY